MNKKKFFRLVNSAAIILVIGLVISACSGTVVHDPAASNLIPNLPGYMVNNTADLQDSIAKFAAGTSLAAANPLAAGLIAGANAITQCYQKAGAIEGRTFINTSDPSKLAVLFVVNRNALLNPANLVACINPKGIQAAASVQICANAYVLNKDNNQFYIGYVATYTEVCNLLCSKLQGCTPTVAG